MPEFTKKMNYHFVELSEGSPSQTLYETFDIENNTTPVGSIYLDLSTNSVIVQLTISNINFNYLYSDSYKKIIEKTSFSSTNSKKDVKITIGAISLTPSDGNDKNKYSVKQNTVNLYEGSVGSIFFGAFECEVFTSSTQP